MIRIHRMGLRGLETVEGVDTLRRPEGEERAWISVVAPTPEEVAVLSTQFGIHELALRDSLKEGHPPKLEEFDDHLFLIAHTPLGEGATSSTRKIAIFLGERWLISVARIQAPAVAQVEERVGREPERYLPNPDRVAHALLDYLMDGFEQRVDVLSDQAEAMEMRAAAEACEDCLHAIQATRRDAARLQRVMRTQRDVLQMLSRANHRALSARIAPYLRDVYDHALRVHDLLEGVRDSLAAGRDAYMSAVNNRLSETMRVLTVIATIMMPLSLVAGIFGMNFDSMPLLKTPVGFWLTMGVMAGMGFGMVLWFRKRRWV